jgi:hypothetical protein
MRLADSARTTQLLQAAFNVIDATLAGHGHRKNSLKDWQSHFGYFKRFVIWSMK